VSCVSLHDANGRRIEINDIVEWTAVAIRGARDSGDLIDGALVMPGHYKVVDIDDSGVWIVTHPIPRPGVAAIPGNPQSLRVIVS